MWKYPIICCCLGIVYASKILDELNLPLEHVAFYMRNNPALSGRCNADPTCRKLLISAGDVCWGYEDNCTPRERRFSKPICTGSANGWVETKEKQEKMFYEQADFGYIGERRKESRVFCRPQHMDDSLLECVMNMRLCRSENVMINYERLATLPQPIKYREDVLSAGHIGGKCRLDSGSLEAQGQHKSPLQSWFSEVKHFTVLTDRPIETKEMCDVIIEEPTAIMKLDATVNMYHHFCDFVNLYASLHFNNTLHQKINVIIWDLYPYRSSFAPMWRVFTPDGQVSNLKSFVGKKVCFKQLLMPFLPRMIFGLYYNMPLVPGCRGSGLMRAFSQHTLHRLGVSQRSPGDKIVQITLISRSTQYRRIFNEDELLEAASKLPGVSIRKIDFTYDMDFVQQVNVSANSDILIGMHGAGLTHTIFQPDWGALFEIYNCGDENCYKDLTRLRGTHYFTWVNALKIQVVSRDPNKMAAHEKFSNYKFDVAEFIRILEKIVLQVRHEMVSHWRKWREHPELFPVSESAQSGRTTKNTSGGRPMQTANKDGVVSDNLLSLSHDEM